MGGGTSSTTLAKSVAPPTAPEEPPAVLDMGGAFAAFVRWVLFFLFGFLTFLILMAGFAPSSSYLNRSLVLQFLLAGAISVSLALWVSRSAASSVKQKLQAEYQTKLAAYNDALPIYYEALAITTRPWLNGSDLVFVTAAEISSSCKAYRANCAGMPRDRRSVRASASLHPAFRNAAIRAAATLGNGGKSFARTTNQTDPLAA